MKRQLSILLVVTLIFTICIPMISFAEEFDKKLEEAIKKAKTLFNITDEFNEFNYYIDKYNGVTVFNLSWSDSDNKLGSIYVSINDDGVVRSYRRYEPYYEEYRPKLPKISKSEALERANEFIKRVAPEYVDNILYKDNQEPLNVNSIYYSFNYIRTENNIPFYDNTISISVDNMTGQVRSYYCNWNDDLKFTNTEGIISMDDAKEIFKDKVGLELVYKLKYQDGSIKPYLVYTVLKGNKSINAKTGEIVKDEIYYLYSYSEKVATEEDNLASVTLTPEELKAIEEISKIISEEEAEKIARKFLNIDDSYELRYINLYNDWRFKDKYIWSLDFYKQDEEKPLSIGISMDGKTGEIKGFNKNIYYSEENKVKYDKDEALEIAKDYIESIQPEKFKEVEYVDWNDYTLIPLEDENKPKSYSFGFMRKANGAYIPDDGFNITIDTVKGEILRYSYSWYEQQLPSTDKVIPLEEAYNILFNEIGMELEYITNYSDYDYRDEMEDKKEEKEAILVYSILDQKPLNIDSYTGELLYSNGDVYKERSIVKYEDIDSSFAKEQIEILAEFGISLPGSEFKPKEDIKQVEFLYLLAKAKNYYINMEIGDEKFEEELYDWLIREGVVKENEKAPDSLVTREEAVKFIIRVLKYDKIADIKGIFTIPFKDIEKINPNLKGYVAIAYGLGIVNGADGYFTPQDNLTREQAATVIYNYLNVEQ